MKMLVETTGDFMLMNGATLEVINAERPTVVVANTWVQSQLGLMHLTVLDNALPDAATDEDFLTYWKECPGDKDLAVASFLSKFAPPVDPDAPPVDPALVIAPRPKTSKK